jgi:hypothetical protein
MNTGFLLLMNIVKTRLCIFQTICITLIILIGVVVSFSIAFYNTGYEFIIGIIIIMIPTASMFFILVGYITLLTKHHLYLKQNFTNWTSGNEKVNNFVQKKQMELRNIVIEWVPYSQFNDIEEAIEDDFYTVYSAKWIDGPLYWSIYGKYMRSPHKKVALKYPHSLQNIDIFLGEV